MYSSPLSSPWGRLLGVLLALAPASAFAQTTYHVATDGDDGAAGTEAAPWATLQQAASTVGPGDTVVVHPGNYRGMDIRTSGTAEAPITFRAEPGTIVDQDNNRTPDGFNLEGASFIVVEGFEVRGLTRTGLRAVNCEHVVFRNNVVEDNGKWGILTGFCDDMLIEGNTCAGSEDEHGIYVSNSGDRPIVRNNVMHSNNGNGLHMNGDADVGGGDGIITGALVENNVIYNNGFRGGSGINCDGVQDSIIRNNLLYENHASGISLYRVNGGGGSSGNLVINNTILQADDARWAVNIQHDSTNNRVFNNVLMTRHRFRGVIDIADTAREGFEADYNVVMARFTTDGGSNVMDLAEWQALGYGANSVVATIDDVFVDAAMGDYHLSASSPALDIGTADEAPAVDFEGDARPQGAGFDVGADERCDGDCTAVPDMGGMPGVDGGPGSDTDGGVSMTGDGGSSTGGGDASTGGDDGEGDDGCGCRAGGRSGTSSAALVLMALVALGRRRRR
ncbi:MAG: hypothetical protein CMN30_29835 [Sandaracinus sp.]|nr:hypothetical protein [Sandaracinus sp.]|tara:strand:+ start:489 stop:2006 length:1518 start_codon:yes stop_codon:yes gene_type:complete